MERYEWKMQTPIADFVKEYANRCGSRFHMPGHKGQAFLGCEPYDITEVAGADALYEAEGIIAESEKNATKLFDTARTLFSTEGSSQCIRAMLYLALGNWKQAKRAGSTPLTANADRTKSENRPYVIAARNVHKAFLYAAALLDFDVVWLYPKEMHSLCSCHISREQLETELQQQERCHGAAPAAVYVTSPDYLGGQLDITSLAKVCHRYGTILAVDNAHGAYLHFLKKSQHPIDLGADICCDSAHKTLPVLTGGAYLQISKSAPEYFAKNAKQAMALFGSTSPSYLIMTSLDLCNAYLADGYRERLTETALQLDEVRKSLREMGWSVEQTDPLKLTIQAPKAMTGKGLAEKLRAEQIECEYADEEYLVLMVTPENTKEDFEKLVKVLGTAPEATQPGVVEGTQLQPVHCEQKLSIRDAIFAKQERVPADQTAGRICGVPTVGCPPAIPIVVPGEEIDERAIEMFIYYGIDMVEVLKK